MFPLRDTVRSRTTPFVVWLLVAVNVLVFLHELRLGESELERFFERYGAVPASLSLDAGSFLANPSAYLALFTSMFLHGGVLHLVGNLWFLGIFGDNVEDRMGHGRFLVFYVLCGLLAGAVHIAFSPGSTVPTVGASGAISGIMGAYIVLYPRARVITLILLVFYPVFVEVPAVVFLGLWFLTQVMSSGESLGLPEDSGGIAFLAHVGGFVAGFLLRWPFARPERR